jgi:hypothetical protein
VPQLSGAVTLKETGASHRPTAALAKMFAGHCRTGAWLSRTVTVNEQVPTLPEASVLEQVTGVTPRLKRLPEAGLQEDDGVPQLSATEMAKLTTASHRLLSQFTTMLVGQVTAGF